MKCFNRKVGENAKCLNVKVANVNCLNQKVKKRMLRITLEHVNVQYACPTGLSSPCTASTESHRVQLNRKESVGSMASQMNVYKTSKC